MGVQVCLNLPSINFQRSGNLSQVLCTILSSFIPIVALAGTEKISVSKHSFVNYEDDNP